MVIIKLILPPGSQTPAARPLITDKAADLTYSHTNVPHFHSARSHIRSPDSRGAYIPECNAH